MHFDCEDPEGECTLVLRLARDCDPSSQMVTIRFSGVRNLALSELGGGYSQICGLTVEDVSGEQWDHVNWHVTDFEDGRIEFMCRHYEVTR